MLSVDKLRAIQTGFKAAYKPTLANPVAIKAELEVVDIDPYAAAVSALIQCVYEYCDETEIEHGKPWLLGIIFPDKRVIFLTVRDAYLHVVVALDTAIAVVGG